MALSNLPQPLQGPVSAALGGASPAYRIRTDGSGLSAVNAGQGLRLRFARSGVTVRSGSGGLSLGLTAVGRGDRLQDLAKVFPRYRGNRVWYSRGTVDEWYANGPLGLEQGFTVSHRARGAGPLTLSLAVTGGLRPVLASGGIAFGGSAGPSTLRYRGLVATDARGGRLRAWWALRSGRVEVQVADRTARYPVRIDPFVQQANLFNGATESIGISVAMSRDGNTALVGGPQDNSQLGGAWVFTRSDSTSWSQQGPELKPSGETGNVGFGTSVALSGDGSTALIGGPLENGFAGAAWVFTRSGSTWSEVGGMVGRGAVGAALQGKSVALSADGGTALIGGPNDNGDIGATWVFTRSGSTWSQQGPKLVGTGAVGTAQQGRSAALSSDGSTALIGGPFDNSSKGAAWVFTRSGSTWSQQGSKLVGMGAVGAAEQSLSVALSGDSNTALIGGPSDNGGLGAAWVFARSGSTWSQQGPKLVGTGATDAAQQGTSVALSGDGSTALSGGPIDGRFNGATWAFTRSGSTWSQQGSKLVGTGGDGESEQGTSVSLSADGRTALIGGPNFGGAWVFAVPQPPTVDSFSPGSGITGSHVTITGTDLWAATSVKFGNLAASFTVVSATQLDATVPNGAVAGTISVVTAAGTATSSTSFTPSLSITQISPSSGPFGTVVTVRGVGFTPSSTVQFNGSAAATAFVNSGEVTATVTSSATNGPLTLTNTSAPVGTVQSTAFYTVTPHIPPEIDSFSPGSGITGSGVTITGSYLSGTSKVMFGSVRATKFTVKSPTRVDVGVPNAAVAGPISVTTAAGTDTSATNFTPTLSITSFSPGSGPVGTVVDIHGLGFTPASTVQFNGTAASSVTFVSSTEVQATVPSGATSGLISLTNTSAPAGTVSSANKFTVT